MSVKQLYIAGSLILISACIFSQNAYSENIIESILLQSIPKEIKDTECPLYITLQAQIVAGDNIYKTEEALIKYRIIGDNGYSSDWRQFAVPKGQTRTDVFRRKIDPAAIAKNSDISSNPTLKREGDKAFYSGWSVLEMIYQDSYRKVYKKYSNKAEFYIECKAFENI